MSLQMEKKNDFYNIDRRQMLGLAGGTAGLIFANTLAGRAEETPSQETSKRRFSLNTGTLLGYNLPIEEEIEITAKAGYDGIEIWLMRLEKYISEGKSLTDLRKRVEDSGLTVENAIGFAPWIVDDDAERAKGVEQIKRDMERLAKIGCFRIAAPASGATAKRIDNLEACGERYRKILEIGEQQGVTPLLELWGGSATLSRLSDVAAIAVAAAHPQASLLLDAYHLYKGGNTWTSLSQLNGRNWHIFHLNDYPENPPRETIADKDRVFPGDGVCPIRELVTQLDEIGFHGVFSLEIFNAEYRQTTSPLEQAKIGLEKMRLAVKK
ncbi:MAG: sugar phosphate isomerase/epimerase [Planctomycetaceae bacterium]|jgi:sugar phosphate isomerase/epimerase|nr:sugar phosphate isomerase/epimerase [Planctomycetaceae bacterium]